MSVEEKLQTMEALWQSLSGDPAAIESPAWHEDELAERERKIESAGFRFYERQAPGLGSYFRESILTDVDALAAHGGVHARVFGYHRTRVT